MRILLVKPDWTPTGGRGQVRYARHVRFAPIGLGILAALSDGHDVRVVDANWESVPFDEPFDLVGITTTTFASQRAFELACRFRSRGAQVVLGGVHASLMPEECLRHADAAVVGEGEYVWKDVLADASRRQLAGVYRADRITDMRDVPSPRRDLLHESSWFTCVEASRGCLYRCRYCYLPSVPWREHRTRPLDAVVGEVASLPQGAFIFVDENLLQARDFALSLFREIAPLRKIWLVQAPTSIAGDFELMDAMAHAGCFNVQMGFQSFSRASLEDAGVDHGRVDRYRDVVESLQQRGIIVSGFFMFGFDTDGPDVFDRTVEAIQDIGVDDANLFVSTPFPGTEFHARYEREGRLLPGRLREQFGWSHAVFQPVHMTPEELENGVQRAYDRLHGHFRRRLKEVIRRQWKNLARNPRFLAAMIRGNLSTTRVGLSIRQDGPV